MSAQKTRRIRELEEELERLQSHARACTVSEYDEGLMLIGIGLNRLSAVMELKQKGNK